MAEREQRRQLARELHYAGELIYFQGMTAKADSAIIVNKDHEAYQCCEESLNAKLANAELQGQLKAARSITVGGLVVRVGVVALAVKGAHELYNEYIR